ncbi:MAG: peroxidase-related enzyme [Gemmatimonadetes bacterium]|nr:peroxidase-related enzyme [Gemmatimonadota bacterium]
MAHHGAALRAASGDAALVAALSRDWRQAAAPPRLRALLEYAARLTRTPSALRREDLEPLRQAGLDDRGILDAAQVVAYFNFVNRLADGLGVELES